MIHLFIDSSIYSKLYSFQKEQLHEIEKLIKLIDKKEIILYLPQQVKDEVKRDREEKLLEFYRNIDKLIPEINFPNVPDAKDKINDLENIMDEYKGKILPTVEKLKDDFKTKIKEEAFLADEIINGLFSVATFIETKMSIFEKAFQRYNIGNPPGKRNSLGDAIIWESLLSTVAVKENLHFIVNDKHFLSMLDKNEFCPFLSEEWQELMKSKIILYKRIGDFTEKNVPAITKSDKIIEREIQIDEERIKELAEGFEKINRIVADAVKLWSGSTAQIIAEGLRKMPNIPPIYFSEMNIGLINALRIVQEGQVNKIEDESEKKKKKNHIKNKKRID